MSANSPTLGPSQAEAASPPNSREDATTSATSIPPVTGNDTTTPTTATVPESQQKASSRPSTPTIQEPARTEIGTSSESVEEEESTQNPVVDVAPAVAPVDSTTTAATTATATTATTTNPTTAAAATPAESNQPATAVLATEAAPYTPLKDMKVASSPIEPTVASLSITLLLISGVRHQFTMDEAYLEQHSVKTGTGKESSRDPFEMSVWQLKECIWKDWKDEWDQRPASAMFIRLIHFGRMLEDRHPLKDCRLNQDSPNVVHMTVRPPEVGDDEMTQRSAKGGFGHQRDNGNSGSTPSCRCVIL